MHGNICFQFMERKLEIGIPISFLLMDLDGSFQRYSLKEHEAIFLKSNGIYFICFLFLKQIFSKVRFQSAVTFRNEVCVFVYVCVCVCVCKEGEVGGIVNVDRSFKIFAFSLSKLAKNSRKRYPIFVKLLKFNHAVPSCIKWLLIIC